MIADLIKLYADANIRIAELERENNALREQVEHLIGMIEQLESDLAHFATVEAFEGKKEAQP